MTQRFDDPSVKADSSDQAGGVDDKHRRELLAAMGRFAYAAPALALLAKPRAAQADYGGPRREGGGRRRG